MVINTYVRGERDDRYHCCGCGNKMYQEGSTELSYYVDFAPVVCEHTDGDGEITICSYCESCALVQGVIW